MGYTQLRKIFRRETRWTDKTAGKHKHDFCVHAVVQLRHTDGGGTEYYDVMKCRHCSSFRSIPREGAINGFIAARTLPDDFPDTLPFLKLKTSHKYIIGFQDAELDV